MGRVLVLVAAVALVLAAPALASGPTPKPLPAASAQPPNPRLTKADVTRSSSRTARSPRGSTAIRRTAGRPTRATRRAAGRSGSGGARPARSRPGRVDDRQRRGHGGVDRPAGRLEDGARLLRRVRRERDQQRRHLARLLRGLPARPRGLPAASQRPQPRPAGAALLLGLAPLLQPRPRLHQRPARLPAARLPTGADGLERLRAGGSRPGPRPSGRSGCSSPRRSSSPASGSG